MVWLILLFISKKNSKNKNKHTHNMVLSLPTLLNHEEESKLKLSGVTI